MTNELKQKILKNENFQISENFDEDGGFTRELISKKSFCYLDFEDIIIYIDEIKDEKTSEVKWIFTLDIGEEEEESFQELVEINGLISELLDFLKKETNIDFSKYIFERPSDIYLEEGEFEIVFR